MATFIIFCVTLIFAAVVLVVRYYKQEGKEIERTENGQIFNSIRYQIGISKLEPLEFEIAGLYYRSSDAHKLARGLVWGTFLTIEPEPKNDHDKYALKIMYKDVHLGYIPSHYSKSISMILRQGGRCAIEVDNNDRSEIPHVWVKLYPIND